MQLRKNLILNNRFQNILVIKKGAIGDFIAGTTAIDRLRKAFPNSSITVLGGSNVMEICPPGPLINHFFDLDQELRTRGYIGLIRYIRSHKFDLVVNLRWTSEYASILSLLSGAKHKAGAGPFLFSYFYTYKPDNFIGDDDRHEYLKNLDIVESLGLAHQEPRAYMHIEDADIAFARNFFEANYIDPAQCILLSPGASTIYKAWPKERFIEIGRRFINEFQGKIAVSWVPEFSALAEEVADKIGKGAIITPQTSIRRIAAITGMVRLCLCNNSGIMHIAYAMDTPVICLNTSIGWAPFGKNDIAINAFPSESEFKGKNRRLPHKVVAALLKSKTTNEVWVALSKKWLELSNEHLS